MTLLEACPDLGVRDNGGKQPCEYARDKEQLQGTDDVLLSAEPTHEGDRVGEPESIVAAPPQGDLASVGFEKAGIANQTEVRDVGTRDRQDSVRKKRSS